MHAKPVAEGLCKHIPQTRSDIVRVEDGILRRLTDTIRAVAHHVSQRPHEHAHLPMEGRKPAEGLCSSCHFSVLDEPEALAFSRNKRKRCKRRKRLAEHDRSRAWAAPAMRRREG